MVRELYDWQMTPITEMIVSDTDSKQMFFLMMELIWIFDFESEKAVSWKAELETSPTFLLAKFFATISNII